MLQSDPLARGHDELPGQLLTPVRLRGALGKRFGRMHRLCLDRPTPADALRALVSMYPDFKAEVEAGSWRVLVGDAEVSEDELHVTTGKQISFVPVTAGSGAAGKIVAGVVLIAASVVIPGAQFLAGAGIGMALGGVSEVLFSPKKASTTPSEQANRDPSFAFDGPVNTSGEGNCVPICYGRMKVGAQLVSSAIATETLQWNGAGWNPPTGITGAGGGGGKGGSAGGATAATEANDSLRSIQYARTLDLISEGEIHGPAGGGPIQSWDINNLGWAWQRSVYLDGTPVANDGGLNFKGISKFICVHGTQDQPVLPGFTETNSAFSVNTLVKADSPIEATFTDADADAVRVVLGFPALVSTENNPAGNMLGTTVNIAIDLQVDGGGWVPQTLGWAWPAATVTANGAVSPAGSYQVRCQVAVNPITEGDYRVTGNLMYRVNGGAWALIRSTTLTAPGFSAEILSPWIGPGVIEVGFFPTREYRHRSDVYSGGESPVLLDTYYPEERDATGGLLWGALQIEAPTYCGQVPYDTISGKCTSLYTRSYRIELPAGTTYGIRVRKLTPDATSQKTRNDVMFLSYATIVEDKLRYPNSALFGLEVDASQFSTVPTRSYDIYGVRVKVPSNYNPWTRTYTGVWDGTFVVNWTDNPAWIWYDLATNSRYGLGKFLVNNPDKWVLYQIARYCDHLVYDGYAGWEPRFTCNAYLQTQSDAIELLKTMASIFRGALYEVGGVLTPVQDSHPAQDLVVDAIAPLTPVRQFTNANVLGGEFHYEGTGLDTRATVAVVWWNDPAQNGNRVPEYVEDRAAIAKYGYREKQVDAVGCTRRGQAHRFGRSVILSEQLQDEIVHFGVGLDAAFTMPGEIIQTLDKRRAGVRHGGRVAGVAGTVLTLDAPVDVIAGVEYEMTLVKPDGTLEMHPFVPGDYYTGTDLNIAGLFSFTPAVGTIWVMSRADVKPELWRVIGVSEGNGITATVSALKVNASKYNSIDYHWGISEPDTSAIEVGPPATPTGLKVTEEMYRKADGRVGTRMFISWDPASTWATGFGVGAPPRGYVVEYRTVVDAGGAWGSTNQWVFGPTVKLPETESAGVQTADVQDGIAYDVKVWAVNALGKRSAAPANVWQWVYGKTKRPSNVAGLTATMEGFTVVLRWPAVADLDVTQYIVQELNPADASLIWGQIVGGDSYRHNVTTAGEHLFAVYALDELGLYSEVAATTTATIFAPSISACTAEIIGPNLRVDWTAAQGSFALDHFEVELRDASDVVVKSFATYSTSVVLPVDWLGAYSVHVTPLDVAGNAGPTASRTVTVAAPGSTFGSAEVIDNTVLLRWTTTAGTLPLADYGVRRGDDYATAEALGRVAGGFATFFERSGGLKKFWITPRDTAGNDGTPTAVAAVVSTPPDFVLAADMTVHAADFTTLTNAYLESAQVTMPIDTAQTWADHFTSNGWATPQDQIDAGKPIYAEPYLSSGTAEWVYDYGTVLPSMQITAVPTYTGEPPQTVISYKEYSGDSWTVAPAGSVAYGVNFRYVRVQVEALSAALTIVQSMAVTLATKLRVDSGSGHANSSDVTGTVVNFNLAFVDIDSITVTPRGTSGITLVVDFTDAPNPTSFRVLAFTSAGVRTTCDFFWTARGA